MRIAIALSFCCGVTAAILPRPVLAQPPPAMANGAACALPPMVKDVPKGAVLDTTWHSLGFAFRTCRIVNRKDTWVAECMFLYARSERPGVYSTEEADSLHALGVFTDYTMFTPMKYRYAVKARSLEEAHLAAVRKRPVHAPATVRKALLAAVSRDSSATDPAAAR